MASDSDGRPSRDDTAAGPQSSVLVLASTSPRRRDLLAALGVPFAVDSAGIDERPRPGEQPAAMAYRLAKQKADAVAARWPDALLLAADTLVIVDNRSLGKPEDAVEAAAILRALRGRDHRVTTAVWIQSTRTGRGQFVGVDTTVTMRDYTDAEIARSIAAGTPFDKAGAYAIQDEDFAPVAGIAGCYCNVVGLPLWSIRATMMMLAPDLCPAKPSVARAICATCPLQDRRDRPRD